MSVRVCCLRRENILHIYPHSWSNCIGVFPLLVALSLISLEVCLYLVGSVLDVEEPLNLFSATLREFGVLRLRSNLHFGNLICKHWIWVWVLFIWIYIVYDFDERCNLATMILILLTMEPTVPLHHIRQYYYYLHYSPWTKSLWFLQIIAIISSRSEPPLIIIYHVHLRLHPRPRDRRGAVPSHVFVP